jgi:hypothetical protein
MRKHVELLKANSSDETIACIDSIIKSSPFIN